MRQYLLLVQSQEHVDALPQALAVLKTRNYDGIWMLFSPAALVDTRTAATEFDKNIAELTEHKERCKAADDLDGAKGYKLQLDDLLLQKVAKIKEAWKTLPPDQQDKAFERVFGQFCESLQCARFRPERMREHYEPGQFIDALNAHRKAWFAPFVPGQFEFGWPTSFGDTPAAAVPATTPLAPVATQPNTSGPEPVRLPPKPEKQGGNPMFSDPAYRILLSMGLPQLEQRAQELKIKISGSVAKIRATIWKHEKSLQKAA